MMGVSFFSFYPSWEETASQFAYLPNMLTPFEEISRALNRKSYWLLFMLLGNIIMFMPIGFFRGCCGGVGAGGSLCWRGFAPPLPLSLCSFS